jgi:outer membrane protein
MTPSNARGARLPSGARRAAALATWFAAVTALTAPAFAAPARTAAPALAKAQGDTPAPLDAIATVRYALAHAPIVLAKQATLATQVASFDQKRAAEFPVVDGQLENQIARSAHTNGAFAQFGISPTSNFSQNTAQVTSTYNLYNGTQQVAAQQARRGAEGAADDVARQAEQTALDATTGFYGLAARRQAVVVAENDLRYQQQLLASAIAGEKVGRVAGVDVLRAQVAVTRSESTLVQARADEADAREALAVQIGATAETFFVLPATLPEPALPPQKSIDVLASAAAASRPDVASAKAAFDAARLGDAAVDADLRPTVQLSGAFGSQVSPTTYVQTQQSIDAQNAATIANYELEKQLFPGVPFPLPVLIPPVVRGGPGFWQFGITSTFTLPLLDYGARAANHRAARAQITSAEANYRNAVAAVEADVRSAARDALATSEKLELAKQSASLARETARIAQLQYKNGVISFNDATQIEQTALSAENDLIAARANYVIAVVRLRLSLGPTDPAAAADVKG